MEIDGYKEIIMAIESLAERVKILERIVLPSTTTVSSSPSTKSTDFWGEIKEGGECKWSKL